MSSPKLSPIAVFAYNRPLHLEKTLSALARNVLASKSNVIVFCDGPKGEEDIFLVEKTREIAKKNHGFLSNQVIESFTNKGLAESIIQGVSRICQEYGEVIVLEDDMESSPHFLEYMNEALNRYENDERVISAHGYVYPLRKDLQQPFFLRGADCWGWATWERGWRLFERDGESLAKEISEKGLVREFNFDNSHDYYQMLLDFNERKNNSWAIRWYASAFLKNKLTLYPHRSLIQNIGLDQSGTHCNETDQFQVHLASTPVRIDHIEVCESLEARRLFTSFFNREKSLWRRFTRKLKRGRW
jgi:hypothetical protein